MEAAWAELLADGALRLPVDLRARLGAALPSGIFQLWPLERDSFLSLKFLGTTGQAARRRDGEQCNPDGLWGQPDAL